MIGGGNDTERRSPHFAQIKPKKNQVCFLSELINLNNILTIRPYPLPNINKMMLKLEVCKCAALLDLKIRYYHIPPSEKSSTLLVCMIIFP